jgi:hypothetical protein
MQLAMRNFDVKKNCFLRKDLIGPVGNQNHWLPGDVLKDIKSDTGLQKQFITL